MNVLLVRDFTDITVTLGKLLVQGSSMAALETMELPWDPLPGAPCGRPDRSCVPAGTYRLVRHDSAKHPQTWALVNWALRVFHEPGDIPSGDTAPARIACLLHTANWVSQLEGCCGIGRERIHAAAGGGSWYIAESMLAMQELKAVLPWTDDHTLTITYAPGVNP